MKKRILILALVLVTVLTAVPFAGAADFTFTDVPTYHKDRTAIEYCVKNEFVKGYTSTTFVPDGSLTREQFAVIWGRTFHLRMHHFNDVTKMPNEFENAILIMQALGHVNGISDMQFGRNSTITREQAIAIAYRAYVPGVDGGDAYKEYADSALISDWARTAVSACKSHGLLDGVFTDTQLKPSQPITRGEMCHLIFNIMKKEHTITVSDTIVNGAVAVVENASVTTNKDGKLVAYPGTTVTLTVTPADKYVLVPGSLKYNNTPITGTSFTMPFENVTITADFAIALTDITIESTPNKIAYKSGEALDLRGLVVKATYADTSTRIVTGYTTSPASGTVLTIPGTTGTITMSILYTENGITKTKDQILSVSTT